MTFSHVWRKFWTSPFVADDRTTQVLRAGISWQLLPAGLEFFGEAGPDLEKWLTHPDTVIVKDGIQRTIWRVALPHGPIYVKCCRANTPRAWAREMLRPSKARLEFENALALRSRGIRCVEPLALGEANSWWPGNSFIITRGVEDATPCDQFLERLPPANPSEATRAIRRQLARTLGRFLAQMHDAGVAHPDPHPGNFLVDVPPSRVPHFTLLDVHAVHFGAPLSWAKSRENLVVLNRWFQMRASRVDRLRFWFEYFNTRRTLKWDRPQDRRSALARELELQTWESNRKFWTKRSSRFLGQNRLFRRIQCGTVSGHVVRDFPEELASSFAANPDFSVDPKLGRILKQSRTSTVAQLKLGTEQGELQLVAKRFQLKKRFATLKNLMRSSPARRSWLNGHHLLDRGIPTARPLAMYHRRIAGVPGTGYVICEAIEDALPLHEAVAQHATPKRLGLWAELLARMLRQMHERNVAHRDLKASNILMRGISCPERATPILIDLVGVHVDRRVSVAESCRNLARLNVSFLSFPQVTRSLRLRFLKCYLAWGPHSRDDWKIWWKRIASATAEKIAKNTRTGRPLA